jgi:hypothetical protein
MTKNLIEIREDNRTKVSFKLLNSGRIEISIRNGKLRIEGDTALIIEPRASNLIMLTSYPE